MPKILIRIFSSALKLCFALSNMYAAYKLRNYDTSIVEILECLNKKESNKYAIFVYYEPYGNVSLSVKNILVALNKCNINPIVVCNHKLSVEQKDVLQQHAHKILIRLNQGADFGGYKDAVKYLIEQNITIQRLGFLNDSVYYFSNGIDDFVYRLFNASGACAAFENWEKPHEYHLQSFAICVNEVIWKSKAFVNFWLNYRPVSNRLYAIECGEKKLTKAVISNSEKIDILYQVTDISKYFDKFDATSIAFNAHLSLGLRKNAYKRVLEPNEVIETINNISRHSPLHTGAYFFARLNCPLVKKDLVYRMSYEAWQIELIYSNVFNEDELAELSSIIRRKGNIYSLSFLKKFLYASGVI